ncbi:MAG TPA: methionine synthase, partial [Planctomycetes bacterium]|nr:methionine synthase [Planctomycetota bacterium]
MDRVDPPRTLAESASPGGRSHGGVEAHSSTQRVPHVLEQLEQIASSRIVLLDGAMGTMVQALGLGEPDYRGEAFADHPCELKGCHDLLCLTRPAAIEGIHRGFLEAGADVITTNTFNANRISLADYRLTDYVRQINVAAARCARRAIASPGPAGDDRPRFVAGSLGPTNRMLSLSPDVGDPGYRAVTFDQMAAAYAEQAEALVEGGVDLLLAETVFDTLNVKACLFALEELFERLGRRLPVIVSVTIADQSGRTLSGQTLEAFWYSIQHAPLFAVGINCALGPTAMRPFVEELAGLVPVRTCCYPNAGLPNEFGQYDESPEAMAGVLGQYAASG